jgi:two-component system chemotaxis sensor kinase CheA
MDMDQYMGMFLEESREHLQSLNQSLLELENDPSALAVLGEIFRSAHTIKGMSATMGFTKIAELTHEMENVLDLLRKAVLKADHGIIDILFSCVDTLEQLVESVATNTEVTIDVGPLITQLRELAKPGTASASPKQQKSPEMPQQLAAELLADQELHSEVALNDSEVKVVQAAYNQGLLVFEVQINLREGCVLKSARAYMVMSALEELGEVFKAIPTAEELEEENFELSFQVFLITAAEADKVKRTIMNISEIEAVTVLPCKSAVPVAQLAATSTAASSSEIIKPDKMPEQHTLLEKKAKGGQSVRVDIDKLDSLLNLVGELVINKTRLEQIGLTHKLADMVETMEQMDRITTDLQSVVMKVRMVPIGQVFNRFPRMIRDLSHELNKEINLIIQGEETELDRTVIDEIGDPLVHLLRNAIDHGIEHPDQRKEIGKNPVGEVRLIARHEGNNVVIMVEDDGKGIDPDIIRRKCVEKGLITQAEADKMDANEAIRMVFYPGFSTSEVVTDVSGRGVGMDAVKTKIESLGGMVDVETKINEGSKFKIRLPLTLAIIQALLVNISEEIYAIPLGSIDSTINITPQDIKTIQNQEVILLRGQIIPIVHLGQVLDIPKIKERVEDDELFVVIVHMGDSRAGIIVDTLIGQQEIVIKSLGKLLAGIKIIAGATILGNGQVALILDVGSLMQ